MDFEHATVSLIIPVHNGSRVLDRTCAAVARYLQEDIRRDVVFVDDGSTDRSRDMLEEFQLVTPRVTVMGTKRNFGKGAAISRGMLRARGAYRIFTDVDLAYSLTDIEAVQTELSGGADVVIACRVLPQSRYVISPSFFHYLYTRHLMSRFFNCFVRALLLPDVRDTQAGLKGFSAHAAETIFSRVSRAGFGFDVEALYIAFANTMRVVEVPVSFRYDDEPTTVRFVQDGVKVISDVIRVRVNGWRGVYNIDSWKSEPATELQEMVLST